VRQWLNRVLGRDRGNDELDCHRVGELLQHYLDGHIDEERARLIEVHLEACRRCGLEAETYRRIKASLATRAPEVPHDAVDRLREFGERLARGEESAST
jgi:anti-sigma factor RsiW